MLCFKWMPLQAIVNFKLYYKSQWAIAKRFVVCYPCNDTGYFINERNNKNNKVFLVMNGITKTYRTNVWDAFAKDTNFRFVDNLSKL